MILLPQLEGLTGEAAAAVAGLLDAELVASARARRELGARLRELFDEVVSEPFPDEFLDILRGAEERAPP